jgi:chromosomal replication initiation ATPase DnaA
MAKMTYPAIAELMKYGDHTSVMHSENEVVDRLMEGDMDTCSPLIKIYSLFESQDKSQAV